MALTLFSARSRLVVLYVIAALSPVASGGYHACLWASSLPERAHEHLFTNSDGDTLFVLPHSWIQVDSLSVVKNGHTLESFRDYRVVDPGNRVWLYTPLVAGDSLFIRYVYSPIPLLRAYARRTLRDLVQSESAKDSGTVAQLTTANDSDHAWTSLRRSGSLVRGVQIGTGQDLAFESALSLQVEGKVGSNVEVVAALSDQDLPIQPEGTTESIRELDKVFVTARSPRFDATIGDYELALSGKRFDRYERKLSGLRLQEHSTRSEATVSAAVSRGEFQSNSFFGLESVQGPYQLSGKSGETGIVVLAGTEHVWVDGSEIKRGENNDYVIDYAAGQITFTPRLLITSDSRIIVEFEYANEDYERQFLAARAVGKSQVRQSSVTATYLSELDDRARPLGFSLKDSDVAELRNAGDSAAFAASSTADSLGPNGGNYARRDTLVDAVAYSIFVYAPPSAEGVPQGQWQVFFDDFGLGNGDYEATADSLGRTYFYWVGPGAGRYLPARKLALPSSSDLTVVRFDHAARDGFKASAEAALSRKDLNSFSGLDDADNDGLAGSLDLGYSREAISLGQWTLRHLALDATNRYRAATFRDLSRSDEIEFDREWAASAARQQNEWISEASVGVSPFKSFGLRGSGGLLTREGAQDSRRYSVTGTFVTARNTSLRGTHTRISSSDTTSALETEWTKQQLDGRGSWWILKPRLKANREVQTRNLRDRRAGFRFLDASAGTEVTLTSSIALDGEVGARTDDSRGQSGVFTRASQANTYAGELRWMPADLGRGALRWVHRDKSFEQADSQSVSSDAGRLELLLSPASRLFEVNFQYDAMKSRTESQIQVFVPVETGTGSFRLENGVYIPDDQGDYILTSRNTGDFAPSSEIKTNSVLWIKPDEARISDNKLWRRFAFETELSVEERTRLPLTLGLLLLDNGKLRTDSTIDGRFSLRQDAHFNRLSRLTSLRLRLINSASQVSRFSNGGQQTIRRQAGLRARIKYLRELRGETEVRAEQEESLYSGVSVAGAKVARNVLAQDFLWTASEKWEFGLALSATEAQDDRNATQVSVREVAPRVGFSRFNKSRVDAEIRWVHASSNRAVVPQEVGQGTNRGENFRWLARGTLAFSKNFTGSLSYTARQDAGERTMHTGRMEVRATF